MKKNNYFLIVSIFLVTSLYSQDFKKLNVLKQKINSFPKDTQVVKELFDFVYSPTNKIPKDTAIAYCKFIYTVSSKIPFDRMTGDVCIALGNHYNSLGNYTDALTYLFEAEKVYSKLKLYDKLSSAYSIIGNTYLGLNNLPEQKTYYSKCYDIALEHNLKRGQAYGAGGLASYFNNTKNFNEAVKWNIIATELFLQQKNYIGYCIALSNGADYYTKLGNLDKAEEDINLAETNLPLANLNYASFVCYEVKAELLSLRKKYPEAIEYLKKALALMVKDKAIHNISETYKRLSDIAYDAKLFKESTDYLNLHIKYKDSVFNETSSKLLLDVQEKYNTEKKNVEIRFLNKENDLNKSEINRKKILIYSVIAVIVLMMILFAFVIKSNIQKNKTNTLLENQKIIIEEKQKEIVDSISYAKRLQDAILPPQDFVNKHIQNNFIYYQPKDIVAGDFYWAETVDNLFFIAAADSTGHGVPGAMVSVVCSNALNRALKEFKLIDTGKILDKARELVIETFEKSASEVKDGMDISLLCIDSINKKIFWSGANISLWYIQDSELNEIKPDKQPIGKTDFIKSFTTHQIKYKENSTFYLFTDGFADQFGGPKGKKFKYKQFSNLLIKNNNLSQKQQAELLNKAFNEWRGNLEQVDDVCVIGIKI